MESKDKNNHMKGVISRWGNLRDSFARAKKICKAVKEVVLESQGLPSNVHTTSSYYFYQNCMILQKLPTV
ncbi:uncharacterized protein LOC127286933 isoform X2 [Leptopilina boulardi]|uniref:uncharacterized protein LOC127286933 isoform X2 n=1 Tax=Leptopilina boulardi TaxID=63433 RepID=UPI0021F57F79|nr:uncharacterized protein LOC127286933 isoform X2 [Leptopilina boulardi]